MNTTELNLAIADLAEMDPAEAPDPADQIAETLAAQLEESEEPGESLAG